MTDEELYKKLRRAQRQGVVGLIFIYAVFFALSGAASYGLALWGHPTAYWFWHNVLGVL